MERLQFSVMDNIMSPDVTSLHRGSESNQVWRGVLLGLMLVGWLVFPALPAQAVTAPQLAPDKKTTTPTSKAVSGGLTRSASRPTAVGSSLQFSNPTYSLNEGAGTALITVTRTGDSSGPVTATVLITDVTTTAGADYAYIGAGTLDTTFADPNLADEVSAIVIQSDNKILVSSAFPTNLQQPSTKLTRFNSDGSLDNTFTAPTPNRGVYTLLEQSDGKILAGGYFTNTGMINQIRNRLARFNSDGSLDTSFADPNLNDSVHTLLVQPDGKILVGGVFTTAGSLNQVRNRLARFNSDGSLDTSFADPNLNDYVLGLALQPDGKILVGGGFNSIGGTNQTRHFLARLNTDGSLDNSFVDSNLNGNVNTLTIQQDGKVVIGGFFTTGGTPVQPQRKLARINSDGSLDTSFTNPNFNYDVNSIEIEPNGKIVAGGYFDKVGSPNQTRKHLARLNSDGTVDMSFADSNSNNNIQTVVLQSDGRIVVGGFFTTVGLPNQPQKYLARFNNDLTLSWADSDTAPKTISLPIIDDKLVEGDETLTLGLVNPQGGATTGSPITATLTIVDNDTTTNLYTTSQTNPSTFGQNALFTATVAPVSATGTITFTEGMKVLGTTTLSNGTATYMTTTLSVGSHVISATYGGDSSYASSTSSTVTQLVVAGCNPLLVTAITDDGSGVICGTFSAALSQTVSTNTPVTINFALTSGNTITFSGSLVSFVGTNVTIEGGPGGIVLNGNGINGDGLRLMGKDSLFNLTVEHFAGREIVAVGTGNRLRQVRTLP